MYGCVGGVADPNPLARLAVKFARIWALWAPTPLSAPSRLKASQPKWTSRLVECASKCKKTLCPSDKQDALVLCYRSSGNTPAPAPWAAQTV